MNSAQCVQSRDEARPDPAELPLVTLSDRCEDVLAMLRELDEYTASVVEVDRGPEKAERFGLTHHLCCRGVPDGQGGREHPDVRSAPATCGLHGEKQLVHGRRTAVGPSGHLDEVKEVAHSPAESAERREVDVVLGVHQSKSCHLHGHGRCLGRIWRSLTHSAESGPFSLGERAVRLTAVACYLTRSKILKIGMKRATIMEPTTPPRKAIISGSIRAVSASVVASTSWS